MAAITTYRPLVEIQVLHRFFLDDGEVVFDENPTLKSKQLSNYDWSLFAIVKPTRETAHYLKNHRLILKNTNIGFQIFVEAEAQNSTNTIFKPLIDLDDKLQLDFKISIKDNFFFNYSNLDTVEHYPLVFRNYTDLNKPALPLINTATESINAANFAIGSDYKKELLKTYKDEHLNEIIAFVSVQMRGADQDHHLVLANGNLPQNTPIFNIRFDNRRTIWNYYSVLDKTLIYTTDPDTKPLVSKGIVTISQGNTDFPSASVDNIYWERDTVGNIIKTYSKIYIN